MPSDDRRPRDGAAPRRVPDRARVLSLPADRLPPHNLEAERGALGSILLDDSCLPDVAEVMAPGDLYRDSHEIIYRAALELHDGGNPVDTVSACELLERRGLLERAGGVEALAELVQAVPHAANARYYAGIVADKAACRRVIEVADATLREAYAAEMTADQLQEALEHRAFAAGDARARGDARPALEGLDAAIAELQRRAAGEVVGVPSGWGDLDDALGNFRPGHVTIVAARPSMGKTAFALNACRNACLAGARALFLSLEMRAPEIALRLLAAEANEGLGALGVGDPQWARVWAAREAFEPRGDLPGPLSRLWVDDTPGRTVSQAGAVVRRMVARHKVDLVAIDYLQLLRADGESRQEQVAEISRSLKTLARSAGVPLLVMAQLNREVDKREGRRPRLSDLRESGQIEADADEVILLHRPEYYDANDSRGVAELILAKNRNGPTGTVRLAWRPEAQRFDSLAGGGLNDRAPAEADDAAYFGEEPFG